MKLHANAALSLEGRRQLCRRVLEEGWTVIEAAARRVPESSGHTRAANRSSRNGSGRPIVGLAAVFAGLQHARKRYAWCCMWAARAREP